MFGKKRRIEPVCAEVYDHGKWHEEQLYQVPEGSLPWRVGGREVHMLVKTDDGAYEVAAVEELPEDIDITPDDLYDALVWRPADRMFRSEPTLLQKINSGLMIGLFIIMCIFAFLIFSSITTGG